MRIIVLNDGETFSNIRGSRLVELPDGLNADQIEKALASGEHRTLVADLGTKFAPTPTPPTDGESVAGIWEFAASVRVFGYSDDTQTDIRKAAQTFASEVSGGEAGSVSIEDDEPAFEGGE